MDGIKITIFKLASLLLNGEGHVYLLKFTKLFL